ncbi:hypothetical protein DOS57_06165 [Staphylococcus felis]|nr:hypothetical protein DOS57_06165 [Staphylococcus felis]REI13427.1 hypothetical protein DOS73_07980 [Staphylococcus felis]
MRLEFEHNSSNSKNCSSNFKELRSFVENSACETPFTKVVEQVFRIQAEWNDEQNCSPNFAES